MRTTAVIADVRVYFEGQLGHMLHIFNPAKAEEELKAVTKVAKKKVDTTESIKVDTDSLQLQAALAKAALAEQQQQAYQQENALLKSQLGAAEELLKGALLKGALLGRSKLRRSESEPKGSAFLSFVKGEQERGESLRSLEEEEVKEAQQAKVRAERVAGEAQLAKEKAESVAAEALQAKEEAEREALEVKEGAKRRAKESLESRKRIVKELQQYKSAFYRLWGLYYPLHKAQQQAEERGSTGDRAGPATKYTSHGSDAASPWGTPDGGPYCKEWEQHDGPSFPHVRRALFPPLPAPAETRPTSQGGVKKLWGFCPGL